MAILLILIGIAALIPPIMERLDLDVGKDAPAVDTSKSEPVGRGNVLLTQTYRDKEEGFSFMYPEDWELEDATGEDFDAIVVIAATGAFGPYARVTVSKFKDDGSYFAATKLDWELLAESQDGLSDVNVTELTDVKLDGRPARKVTMTAKNDVDVPCAFTYYLYTVGPDVYLVLCVSMESAYDRYEPILDAIIDSYTITKAEPDPGELELAAAKEAYADIVRTLAAENDSLAFDLINVTGGDVPELLVDMSGYFVSLYTWADGEAVPVMDYWGYGAFGNPGYEYLPGQNVIRNYNSDLAGAIVYESYMTINPNCEVVSMWDGSLSTWYFLDLNDNYMDDEGEPYLDEPIYYYGDTQVTPEQYAKFQISGDYLWMSGRLTAGEMLRQLGAL